MKKCKKCEVEFEGRSCKPCAVKYMREWNAKNPDKVKINKSKTYLKHKEKDKERNKKWVENNRERSNQIKKDYKERNREEYLSQQREYARKRYEKNREEISVKQNSETTKERIRLWRQKNRDILNRKSLEKYHNDKDSKIKFRARYTVQNALKSGRLMKGEKCSRCGFIGKLHAHHSDYLKPLDVEWLCIPCHKNEHSKYFKQDEIEVL